MNRRCDFHFELEISTYMIRWEPSAKIIAENLVSAKIKVLLALGLFFLFVWLVWFGLLLVFFFFFSNFNWFYFTNILYEKYLSGRVNVIEGNFYYTFNINHIHWLVWKSTNTNNGATYYLLTHKRA